MDLELLGYKDNCRLIKGDIGIAQNLTVSFRGKVERFTIITTKSRTLTGIRWDKNKGCLLSSNNKSKISLPCSKGITKIFLSALSSELY